MTGILCVNKPCGITSFGTVARVRRMLGHKKCGHAGTLDPMATGVLPVLIGGATKFAELLPNQNKRYLATVRLGIVTDTLDVTGNVLENRPVNVSKADFEAVLEEFRGEILQIPPMYSAVFHNGVRLYELARQGIEVERNERSINIYSLQLVDCDEENNEYVIDVKCSKGTYIRTLASDIGKRLGCGAVLSLLCRTEAAGYALSQCIGLEELEKLVESGNVQSRILPIQSAFEEYGSVYVSLPQSVRFKNGSPLNLDRLTLPCESGILKVFSQGDKSFLGLGEISQVDAVLKVKKMMVYGD